MSNKKSCDVLERVTLEGYELECAAVTTNFRGSHLAKTVNMLTVIALRPATSTATCFLFLNLGICFLYHLFRWCCLFKPFFYLGLGKWDNLSLHGQTTADLDVTCGDYIILYRPPYRSARSAGGGVSKIPGCKLIHSRKIVPSAQKEVSSMFW